MLGIALGFGSVIITEVIDNLMQITLVQIVSLCGLVFGVAGFVLGVLNYLRDRAKVVVDLQWDLKVTENAQYDPNKFWGLISVVNIGRRPTYISHVALKLPKGSEHNYLLIFDGIAGKKLTEGDPREIYIVSQDGMEKYAKDWRSIVAQVNDSTGRVWRSKRLRESEVPSWAKADDVAS